MLSGLGCDASVGPVPSSVPRQLSLTCPDFPSLIPALPSGATSSLGQPSEVSSVARLHMPVQFPHAFPASVSIVCLFF